MSFLHFGKKNENLVCSAMARLRIWLPRDMIQLAFKKRHSVIDFSFPFVLILPHSIEEPVSAAVLAFFYRSDSIAA